LGLTFQPTESDACNSVQEDSFAILRQSSALLKNFQLHLLPLSEGPTRKLRGSSKDKYLESRLVPMTASRNHLLGRRLSCLERGTGRGIYHNTIA
jgi:hypothetical protein